MKYRNLLILIFGLILKLNQAQTVNLFAQPNPCDTSTVIYFSINGNDTVNLEVINTLGQKVNTLVQNTVLSASTYFAYFNTQQLTNGVYLISLSINSKKYNTKLIISHLTTKLTSVKSEFQIIDCYPNPIKNQFFIQYGQSTHIYIYDYLSRLVFEENNISESVNLEHIPSGIYHCQIFSLDNRLLKNFNLIKAD